MAELNLNQVGADSLVVAALPASLPRCRKQDGRGGYSNKPDGSAMYEVPTHALIQVTGQPIRWRADGIAPDSLPGFGMPVAAGGYINWTDPLGNFASLIQKVQFVRAEGATGNAVLEIAYFN